MEEDTDNGIKSLGAVYSNKNPELRRVVKYCWECSHNTTMEGSAGSTIGADEHFIKRQKEYVKGFENLLKELKASPIPDVFGMPDTQFKIDLSNVPKMIATDKSGATIPLNEDLQLVTIEWVTLAVMLARSDSAGIRGSALDHDHLRAENQAKVITKRIAAIENGPKPDFSASADPGAERQE